MTRRKEQAAVFCNRQSGIDDQGFWFVEEFCLTMKLEQILKQIGNTHISQAF